MNTKRIDNLPVKRVMKMEYIQKAIYINIYILIKMYT